jgi:hypothetical protein
MDLDKQPKSWRVKIPTSKIREISFEDSRRRSSGTVVGEGASSALTGYTLQFASAGNKIKLSEGAWCFS